MSLQTETLLDLYEQAVAVAAMWEQQEAAESQPGYVSPEESYTKAIDDLMNLYALGEEMEVSHETMDSILREHLPSKVSERLHL